MTKAITRSECERISREMQQRRIEAAKRQNAQPTPGPLSRPVQGETNRAIVMKSANGKK